MKHIWLFVFFLSPFQSASAYEWSCPTNHPQNLLILPANNEAYTVNAGQVVNLDCHVSLASGAKISIQENAELTVKSLRVFGVTPTSSFANKPVMIFPGGRIQIREAFEVASTASGLTPTAAHNENSVNTLQAFSVFPYLAPENQISIMVSKRKAGVGGVADYDKARFQYAPTPVDSTPYPALETVELLGRLRSDWRPVVFDYPAIRGAGEPTIFLEWFGANYSDIENTLAKNPPTLVASSDSHAAFQAAVNSAPATARAEPTATFESVKVTTAIDRTEVNESKKGFYRIDGEVLVQRSYLTLDLKGAQVFSSKPVKFQFDGDRDFSIYEADHAGRVADRASSSGKPMKRFGANLEMLFSNAGSETLILQEKWQKALHYSNLRNVRIGVDDPRFVETDSLKNSFLGADVTWCRGCQFSNINIKSKSNGTAINVRASKLVSLFNIHISDGPLGYYEWLSREDIAEKGEWRAAGEGFGILVFLSDNTNIKNVTIENGTRTFGLQVKGGVDSRIENVTVKNQDIPWLTTLPKRSVRMSKANQDQILAQLAACIGVLPTNSPHFAFFNGLRSAFLNDPSIKVSSEWNVSANGQLTPASISSASECSTNEKAGALKAEILADRQGIAHEEHVGFYIRGDRPWGASMTATEDRPISYPYNRSAINRRAGPTFKHWTTPFLEPDQQRATRGLWLTKTQVVNAPYYNAYSVTETQGVNIFQPKACGVRQGIFVGYRFDYVLPWWGSIESGVNVLDKSNGSGISLGTEILNLGKNFPALNGVEQSYAIRVHDYDTRGNSPFLRDNRTIKPKVLSLKDDFDYSLISTQSVIEQTYKQGETLKKAQNRFLIQDAFSKRKLTPTQACETFFDPVEAW